jgi:transcriptional antiterminator NusG
LNINWFILYVRTGREERVVDLLERRICGNVYTPFVPKKEYPRISKGVVEKESKICFPGYVFIKSCRNSEEFLNDTLPIIDGIKDAFFFLYYGSNKRNITLAEEERVNIDALLNDENHMIASIGFTEGEKIRIISGVLFGIESNIIKINKQKRTAVIETSIFGDVRQLTVMLEVLEKA